MANKDTNYGRRGYYRRDLIEKEEAEARAALEKAEAEKAAAAAAEKEANTETTEEPEATAENEKEAVVPAQENKAVKNKKVVSLEKLIKKYHIWNYILTGFAGGEPIDTVFAEDSEASMQNKEK